MKEGLQNLSKIDNDSYITPFSYGKVKFNCYLKMNFTRIS